MSADGEASIAPWATGKSNPRSGSQVEAKVKPEPFVLYRPETNQLLIVPPESVTAVLTEIRSLDRLLYNLQCAKEACLTAAAAQLDAQRASAGPTRTVPQSPQIAAQADAKLDAAQKNLEQKQKEVDDAFKGIKLDDTGGKLYELIPVKRRKQPQADAKTASQRDGHTWGQKWTYVRSDKVQSHFRSYSLNHSEQEKYQNNQDKSIVDDKGKVDFKKLGEQVRDLETSVKWKKDVSTNGVLFKELNESIHHSLEEWANGVNSGQSVVKIEPEFQLARYFAGAGVSATWDPKKGNVAFRADARAEFDIAAGKISAASYLPSQAGHMIRITGPKTKTVYEAGLIRFGIEVVVAGMAGASASAQLGLTVDYTDAVSGKAGLRGKPSATTISAKPVDVTQLRDGADVGAAADVFAGARASGELKGKIEWNSPEEKKFKSLCEIGPSVSGQVGIGASAVFKITYVGGKFRVLASASVCVGLGAGGKLDFEVDAPKTLEFMKYLSFMLYAVGYEYVEIIAERGFTAWKGFSLWAIKQEIDVAKAALRFAANPGDAITVLEAMFEKELERVALMNRVLAQPKELEYSPPETKGMILYQLTRHSKLTDANPQNYNWDSLETLGRRKQAVLVVLKKARSKAEFQNIMQHMTSDGSKDARGWEANFDQVKTFLDMGFDPQNLDQQAEKFYRKEIAALYGRLYDQPVLGYPFVDNDNPIYVARADLGDHDGFMVAGGYDPGSPIPNFDDAHNGPTRLA